MYYPTRLVWQRTRGVAQCGGVRIELTTQPAIPGLQEMTEMDYLPGQAAVVRERCDARRDMTSDEIRATITWLHQTCTPPGDAASGETSVALVVVHV
jgi:hypothetical protein